ncbi:MAG: hypothetical protein ACI8UR_000206 [Natronomonas sp.]|jgi:hypothetical protein|uniref:sterol carrier protein n=1 Tax=Natronomonas sp. TaxID=2184060 RepID=UPI003989279B
MRLYPTKQWLEEYGRIIDESKAMDDVATGWGTSFNGDIRIDIEDLPLSETTLGDLPDDVLEGVPEAFRTKLLDLSLAEAPSSIDESIRATLPERPRDLLTQLEEYVIDGTIYAYVGLESGNCTGVEVLDDPDKRDVGFEISGSYGTWRQIVDGRPAASAILSGDLHVEGSRPRQLQYFAVLQLLGDLAAEVETDHIFEKPSSSPSDVVVDNAVRQPVIFQRFAHRQATLASKTLNLL